MKTVKTSGSLLFACQDNLNNLWLCCIVFKSAKMIRLNNDMKEGNDAPVQDCCRTGAERGIFHLSKNLKKKTKTGAKFSSKNRLGRGKF